MVRKWRIIYWESRSGQQPIYRFIEKQALKAKAKIFNTFELLEEYGVRLGTPHVKKLSGTVLWELRILGQDSLRFFYVAHIGKEFLILHGFVKKSQKTPKKEMGLALKRLSEYRERK